MEAAILSATEQQYRNDPEAARSTPAVKAHLADGRAELSAGSHTWHADLPPAIGGTGSAPSPTAYLLGALAGCAVALIRDTLAPQLGVRVDDISATARCITDARGLLGMDGVTPDLSGIEVEISIVSPDPQDRIDRIHAAWLERCPIYLALLKPNAVNVRLSATIPA